MNRRTLLKSIGSAGVLGAASPLLRSQEQVARATRGMATPRIKDISVIECEPAGTRLTVVKITTDQLNAGLKSSKVRPYEENRITAKTR